MAGQHLQKAPAGLLQLYRLRSGGVGPNVFSDELTPTVESVDFYGADRIGTGSEASAAGAFPRTAGSTISANPRRLLAIHGQVLFGAAVVGTYVQISVYSFGFPGSASTNGVWMQLASYQFVPLAAMAALVVPVVANLPGPIILPAGHTFRCVVASDVAGVDHVARVSYTFQRLDND